MSWGHFLEYLQAAVNCTWKSLSEPSAVTAQATPELWVWLFLVKGRGTMAVTDSLLTGSKWNPCLRYLCEQLVTEKVNKGDRIPCSHVKNPTKPISRTKPTQTPLLSNTGIAAWLLQCLLAWDSDVEIPPAPTAQRTFRWCRNKDRDAAPGARTDRSHWALNRNRKFYSKKSHRILELFYVKFNRISSYCLWLYFLCFDLCPSKPVFFLFLFLFFTLWVS